MKFRRVGLAVSLMEAFRQVASVRGPLVGTGQTVHRGELKAFVLALEDSSGHIYYISDCDNVVKGWHQKGRI